MNNRRSLLAIFFLAFFFPILSLAANRKLNVLFCVKSFPAYTNWFILNQMTEFVEAGHNITILSRDPKFTTANDHHPDIVRYNLLEKTFVDHLPDDLRSFDIILCQFSSLAPYAIDFIEKYNIAGKLFVFVRGAFCYRHASVRHKKLRKKIFKKAFKLFPVCKFSEDQLIQLGCDPNKIKIIHSTIDCNKFPYKQRPLPQGKIKIVTTSRLTEQKGLEYAIKAMKAVLAKHPNCEYKIIGDGELREKLTQLIYSLHLEKNVFLVGWKTPDALRKILYKSHFFLHPSVTRISGGHEATPTSIMEALATGLPAICTYHAGIPELIEEGITGFLVPEKDENALAKKIEFLIEHPEIWNRIGLAGRKAVEKNYDKKTENKKFINFCRKYIFSKSMVRTDF